MKQSGLIFLSLLLVTYFDIFAQPNITGKWKGVNSGDTLMVIFDTAGYVWSIENGDTIGGNFTNEEGHKATLTYYIDYQLIPYHIDMVLTVFLPGNKTETTVFRGLFELSDNKKLKISMGEENADRPKEFLPDDDEHTLILFREK